MGPVSMPAGSPLLPNLMSQMGKRYLRFLPGKMCLLMPTRRGETAKRPIARNLIQTIEMLHFPPQSCGAFKIGMHRAMHNGASRTCT
jgi:hypothetical protein